MKFREVSTEISFHNRKKSPQNVTTNRETGRFSASCFSSEYAERAARQRTVHADVVPRQTVLVVLGVAEDNVLALVAVLPLLVAVDGGYEHDNDERHDDADGGAGVRLGAGSGVGQRRAWRRHRHCVKRKGA